MRSEVRQERIKLFANCLNIVSAGCVIGAFVTAPITWLTKTVSVDPFPFTFVVIGIVMAAVLHSTAQLVL